MTNRTGAAPVVLVCPDAFKGSLTAADAADAIAAGVRRARPDAGTVLRPLADGGEGTLDVLAGAWGVRPRETATVDALHRPATALYGISGDGRLGVVELAQASGLPAVAAQREPLLATTLGTGHVVREVLDAGVDAVLLCLGGSATTDGGAGILRALGVRLLDADGRDVPDGGAGLAQITRIDTSGLHPRARHVRWRLAVDVSNPLVGPRGAAAVFGPQKGAGARDVELLDAALARWATVLADATGTDVRAVPGAGAAGGVAGGLRAVLGAELVPGARLVADAVGLPEAMRTADLVLTGEGSLDSQSLGGKVVGTVAALARATHHRPPVVALAGQVLLPPTRAADAGLAAAFSLATGPAQLADLLVQARTRLTGVAEQVARLVLR